MSLYSLTLALWWQRCSRSHLALRSKRQCSVQLEQSSDRHPTELPVEGADQHLLMEGRNSYLQREAEIGYFKPLFVHMHPRTLAFMLALGT